MDNKKIIYLKVKNSIPEDIISTFSFAQLEEAYAEAKSMEQNGIDVELIIPGAAESLASELGLSLQETQNLKESIEDEIDDHD